MTPEEFKAMQDKIAAYEERDAAKPKWKDPACPKCGLVLGNRMAYCCPHSHCPVGLN